MLEPQQPKMSAWVVKMERGAIKKKRLRIKKRQPGEESTLPAVEVWLENTTSNAASLVILLFHG